MKGPVPRLAARPARRYRRAALEPTYDIAVLGTTPAGCAAACILAARRKQVALLSCPAAACESPLCEWVPRAFWRLPGLPPSAAKDCGASPFRVVRYYSADLAKRTQCVSRAKAGDLLRSADLREVLLAAAKKAGAKIHSLPRRPAISLGEESIRLPGSKPVWARLLLIAQGRPADVLSDLSLPVRSPPDSRFAVAGLDVPLGPPRTGSAKPARPPDLAGALHVVASRQRGRVGMFFLLRDTLHLRVLSPAGDRASLASALSGMLADLRRAGIVPADLALSRAQGAVWTPPAGEALDLETHAAKRCLLCGTAGGFADSITGATLLTSVRSAGVACEAALASLAATGRPGSPASDPQGALMRFRTDWREALADGLRPPSTSLDVLLPLLFANHRLAEKFTRALLSGESI